MRERLPAYDIIDHPVDAPVVLVGPPDRIRGSLKLSNGGDEAAVLRQARLVGDRLAASSTRLRTVKLAPGRSAEADLRFQLPPTTPPGEYEVEVEVGGTRRMAIVHVSEASRVEVVPPVLTVELGPGEMVEKRVALVNQGNIPTTVDPRAAVPLDDELLTCRVLRQMAANFPNRENYDFDGLLREIAAAGRDTLSEASVARVRVVEGSRQVGPGETVPLTLEIQAPARLRHGSRYTGRLVVGSAVLQLFIVPHTTRPADDNEKPPAPTEPRASTAKAKTTTRKRSSRGKDSAPEKGASR